MFEKGHPRRKTTGHRVRKTERWPKYSAKRLPNVADLAENSSIPEDEKLLKREEYAQGALIMFYPFRELKGKSLRIKKIFKKLKSNGTLLDLLDEGKTWWQSFMMRKNVIYNNTKSLETLNSIQNYYESFCTSKNITGEPTFEEDFIHKEPVPENDKETDDIDFQDLCSSLTEKASKYVEIE